MKVRGADNEGWPLDGGSNNDGCNTLVDGGNAAKDGVWDLVDDSETRSSAGFVRRASCSSLRFFAMLR